jgi:hypothetical protein
MLVFDDDIVLKDSKNDYMHYLSLIQRCFVLLVIYHCTRSLCIPLLPLLTHIYFRDKMFVGILHQYLVISPFQSYSDYHELLSLNSNINKD